MIKNQSYRKGSYKNNESFDSQSIMENEYRRTLFLEEEQKKIDVKTQKEKEMIKFSDYDLSKQQKGIVFLLEKIDKETIILNESQKAELIAQLGLTIIQKEYICRECKNSILAEEHKRSFYGICGECKNRILADSIKNYR